MAVLNDILNLLPRALRARYKDASFWTPKANQILEELNQMGDLEELKSEYCLPLVEDKTDYTLPSFIKKFLDIWDVDSNTFLPDKLGPKIDYTRRENRIRLNDQATFTQETYSGVVTDTDRTTIPIFGGGSTWATLSPYVPGQRVTNGGLWYIATDTFVSGATFETDADSWLLLTEDMFKGFILEMTSGPNLGYTRVIETFEPSTGNAVVRFPFYYDNVLSDTNTIHKVYLIADYVRGFQLRDDDVAGCPLLISDEVQNVIEAGLKFYGYLQAESASPEAQQWERHYKERKQAYFKQISRGVFQSEPHFKGGLTKGSFTVPGYR